MQRGKPIIVELVVLSLLVTGCRVVEKKSTGSDLAKNEIAAGNEMQDESPVPPSPVEIKGNTEALDFAYSWPGQAAAIPKLDEWLRGNAEGLRKSSQRDADRDMRLAKGDGYPFRGYSYEERWSVVADTPRALVLQSDGYVYTGGAHGMPITTAIIWDKRSEQRLPTSAVLNVAILSSVAKDGFCAELDRQRAVKRGAPVNASEVGQIAAFTDCVDPAKQTILPISRNGEALDAVRFVIGPYEAGSYAEGRYTIDLPIDQALLGAVTPSWRDAFIIP